RRNKLTSPQDVHGQEGRDHAERTVERAAVGHAVEVAARHDGPGLGRSPPGPLVAVAVLLVHQAAYGCLLTKPVPQRGISGGPGVAPVAAGGRVQPDRLKGGPERGEPLREVAHGWPSMGTT